MANSRQYLGPVDDNKAIATKEYVDANTLPTITTGDSGKVLTVKIDESGAEWVATTIADEADLRAKLAAIGASNATLVIATTIPIADDLAIPSNVALSFKRAGQLQPAVGTTLTINGAIDAGLWQIFGGEGTTTGTPFVPYVLPQWFGAVGDGVTNDTDAFVAASALINSLDGGKLVVPPGTYIVGKQEFAGATGKGYSYKPSTIIYIANCTHPVIIEGYGAILKAADGLKFASFDPVTGEVYNPGSMPFVKSDYRADAYKAMIWLYNNANVVVRGFELDGNIQNLELGGYWGDSGRQCAASGISASTNNSLHIEDVYTHHHGLDGYAISYPGLTETSPRYPHTLINVVSEYNARQGLSWVGGTQLTAMNCNFNHTGQSTFGSAPQGGLDIEAESSICRNGTFINCEMRNNKGYSVIAYSGNSADMTFISCMIGGESGWALQPMKPRMTFINCTIIGKYTNMYYSTTVPSDSTHFQNCLFSDEEKYASTLYGIGTLDSILSPQNNQKNIVYDSCHFITTRCKPGQFNAATLRNCTFNVSAGTTYVNNKGWYIHFQNCQLENVTVNENITDGIPEDAFYIVTDYVTANGRCFLNSSSAKLKWANWSWGYTGLLINANQLFNSINLGGISNICIGTGTAAPASGTYEKGDRIINISPAEGQPKGWICTVSGEPGTWVSEGNL